jgi:hypothetical protein
LGLIRYPGAFLAALGTLIGFSIFFRLFYPGSYRHEALWLSFLIASYWITTGKGSALESRIPLRLQPLLRSISDTGWGFFVLLMGIQVLIGVTNVMAAAGDGPPFSCSRDLGALIGSRPDLRDATIIADPELLLESLPYYVSNPTYLMREQRFGRFVSPDKATFRLTLDDVLANARRLRTETNKPVLVLLPYPLDPLAPFAQTRIIREFHGLEFVITPEQVRAFTNATQLIESYPAALTDENFDVYLLK